MFRSPSANNGCTITHLVSPTPRVFGSASGCFPELGCFYHFCSRRVVEMILRGIGGAKSVLPQTHVLQQRASSILRHWPGEPWVTWRRPEKLASSRSSLMPRQKPRGEMGLF
ncbi:hypothetical protein MTO96_018321 [Rhipicephalus appendiculatus]